MATTTPVKSLEPKDAETPMHYLLQTFTEITPDEVLLEDFGCWFDANLLNSAHMYVTDKHLCWHVHGNKGNKAISWASICDLQKKNSAKIIPNAIAITTDDHQQYWFSFVNRNHVFKSIHQRWKGKAHGPECLHEHDHSHDTHLSKLHPEYTDTTDSNFGDKRTKSEKEMEEGAEIPIIKDHKIEEFYDMKDKLGSGAFSIVKLAVSKKAGEKRAVKIIDKEKIGKEKKEMLDREVDILKRIQHQNIVSVVEIFETEKHLYLVMELATGGELFDEIVAVGKYSEKDASKFIKEITEAVGYLHRKGIVHRDLKPENLLLSAKGPGAHLKLADFGLSKVMEAAAVLETQCGTPGYVAPEVLMGTGYDQKVDIWSIGVIMYILLCGFPPFYADNNAKLFEKIMRGDFQFLSPYWDNISDSAKDLIKHMIVTDPEARYSAEKVLAHPWVGGHTASDRDLTSALTTLKKTTKEGRTTVLASAPVARMANQNM